MLIVKPFRVLWRVCFFLFINCIIAVITAVVLYGMLEAYFRIRYGTSDAPHLWVQHDERGWDTTPSRTELTSDASGSTVFFVGDSFTDGTEWPRMTIEKLQRTGTPVHGVGLGVSGYGTIQEYLKVKEFSNEKPDVVVLLFFAWNDLRDNYQYPAIYYSPERIGRPYFQGTSSGYTLVEGSASIFERLLSSSEVYRRIIIRSILKWNAHNAERDINLFARESVSRSLYYDESSFWKPFYLRSRQDDLFLQSTYDVTDEAFRLLDEHLDSMGTRLIVIGIDNAFTVDADVREAHLEESDDLDTSIPLRRIDDIMKRHHISFIDGTHALRARRTETRKKIYNQPEGNLSAHLEPEGEDVIAELAANAVRNALSR